MENNTYENAIRWVTETLQEHSTTPHLDAQLLLMHTLSCTREHLFTYPENMLTQDQKNKLEQCLARRLRGEPMAYILGYQEFWSLKLTLTTDVLIPRPETEHLVEWALTHLPEKEKIKIADLGVGSGAIAIALAHDRPHWEIHATDNNQKALAVAKENAKRYQLTNIHFYLGDWCAPLPDKNYSAILSNPPYIDHKDPHLKDLKFEPTHALDGGEQGLDAIKIIIREAQNYLSENGYLIMEHGYDQQEKIMQLLEEAKYQDIKGHQDFAHLPRFVTAKKS